MICRQFGDQSHCPVCVGLSSVPGQCLIDGLGVLDGLKNAYSLGGTI